MWSLITLFLVLTTFFGCTSCNSMEEDVTPQEYLPKQDSFSEATRLPLDNMEPYSIINTSINEEYWVVYIENLRSPLIYINSSISDYLNNFTLFLYDNQEEPLFLNSYITEDASHAKVFKFENTYRGDHYIKVVHNVSVKGDYHIGVFVSPWGDTVDRSYNLEPNTVGTDSFNFSWTSETRYWRIELNESQRCWLFFTELSINVLEGTTVRVFKTLNNPIVELLENGSGIIDVSFRALGKGSYFIELERTSMLDREGSYELLCNATQNSYSFDSAEDFSSDSQYIGKSRFGDEVYVKIFLEKNSKILFNVFENNTGDLDGAQVFVYSPPYKHIIASFYEDLQLISGEIKCNFTTSISGTYHIAIFPGKTSEITFGVEIDNIKKLPTPETLVWTKNDIIFGLLTFLFVPLILSYGYFTRFGYLKEEWEATSPLKTCFEYFAVHETFKRINTKPYSFIDLVYVGGRAPVPASLTFAELTPARTRINAVRKKSLWDGLLGISIVFFFYFFGSIMSWVFLGDNLVPFERELEFYLVILTLVFGPLLVFLLLKGNNLNAYFRFISGVSEGILKLSEEFSYSSVVRDVQIPEHLSIEAKKKIHLSRRAWNHARHDYKSKKFETFIIKADTAIKFAIEARLLQTSLYDPENIPSEFLKMSEILREKGFDLPSGKDVDGFRYIRNKIVHSASDIDMETAERAFQHYIKFLNRLGLRA